MWKIYKAACMVLACVALTTGLVGCGSSSGSGTVKKTVTLKVINYRPEDQSFYNSLNAKFEKEYPEVKILYDAVPTSNYTSLLSARIAANEVDVFCTQSGMELDPSYSTNMLPLDKADCLKGVNEDALKLAQNQGKQVMLPLNTVSMVVFYNKQIFRDNNLQVPKTWPEFIQNCKTLKSKNISPIMYGGKDQWPINCVFDALEPDVVRANEPNFFTDVRSGKASYSDQYWAETWNKLGNIVQYFQKDSSGLAYSRAPGLFAQGKAAMMIDGSWSLAQIIAAQPSFEYGVFVLPSNDSADKNTYVGFKIGGGIAAYYKSAHKDYALKYLSFHMRDDNYKAYVDSTMMSSVKNSVSSNKVVGDAIKGYKQVLICENSNVIGVPWNVSDYGNRILLGKMTPATAFKRQASDIQSTESTWKVNIGLTH